MSEHEIAGAVGAAALVIATAIRWGVRRLAKAQDRSTDALIKNAESNGRLEGKLDKLDEFGIKLDAHGQQLARLADALERGEPTARHRRVTTSARGVPADVIRLRPEDDNDH